MNRRNYPFVLAICLLVGGWFAVRSSDAKDFSVEDLYRVLLVKVTDEEHPHSQVITIDSRYRLEIADSNNDGFADSWRLFENDKPRCHRWSRAGKGAPDAGELFNRKGESLGAMFWGHWDDAAAEAAKERLDEELRQLEEKKR